MQGAGQGACQSEGSQEGNIFAQLGLLGRSNKAVPQALTRRALDLLTYLAKHHVKVAKEMLIIKVPTPEEQANLVVGKPVRAFLLLTEHSGDVCSRQATLVCSLKWNHESERRWNVSAL